MGKGTTIRLTSEQREQIRKVTGQDHEAMRVEAVPSASGGTLATGAAKRFAPKRRKIRALSAKRRLAPASKRRLAPASKRRMAPASKRRMAPAAKARGHLV